MLVTPVLQNYIFKYNLDTQFWFLYKVREICDFQFCFFIYGTSSIEFYLTMFLSNVLRLCLQILNLSLVGFHVTRNFYLQGWRRGISGSISVGKDCVYE